MQYEPIELIKLFIVFFLAATWAKLRRDAQARPWSVRANLRYLGPLFIGWGASMAILVLQRDLGMATLLLATFAALLYVATRRVDIVLGGIVIFALAAFWAIHHYPYVQTRIAVWRNPFSDPLGAGYQSSQAYYGLAAGGFFGTGLGLGHPGFIPDVATDYVFAAFCEEFGLLGALCVIGVFVVMVRRMFATATAQPDLLREVARRRNGRDTRISGHHHHRRRDRALSAHRHYVTVYLLWRQLAGCQLLARRAPLGDELARVRSQAFWLAIIALALAAIVGGYMSGREPRRRRALVYSRASRRARTRCCTIPRIHASTISSRPTTSSSIVRSCSPNIGSRRNLRSWWVCADAAPSIDAAFVQMRVPIAFDVDPSAAQAVMVVQLAREAGDLVLLHLENAPTQWQLAQLRKRFGTFDGVASRSSERFVQSLDGTGLLFFDERGDADAGEFSAAGIPIAQRDETVDDQTARGYIRFMLARAVQRSQREGRSVVLMRPQHPSLDALEALVATRSVQFVALTQHQ